MEWLMEKAQGEVFGERDVAPLAQMMLQGVDAIHKVGIIHRDLKPDNFRFTSKESGAQLKMLDFGLATPIVSAQDLLRRDASEEPLDGEASKPACADQRQLRRHHTAGAGTVLYMAPEAWHSKYGPELTFGASG